MKLSKNLTRKFAKSSALVLLLASTTNAAFAATESFTAVDVMKVYKQYSLVQEANQVLDKMEQSFKSILSTAESELAELEKTAKPEELEAKNESIQSVIDEQVVKVQEEKDLYNTTINRNFEGTLQKLAKEKGYSVIFDRGFVIYPDSDITDSFLLELEKTPRPNKDGK